MACKSELCGGNVAVSDIPILSMLRTRLQWSQERQRVLAENVANADTPKFRPRDLVAPQFEDPTQVASAPVATVSLAVTDSGHIAGMGSSGSAFRSDNKSNYEIRPTGNAVNLEDEMMKVAANQMDYQAVTAIYTRSLNLMKTALGKR
jgi:flagellar basal-body rod protein FlgB